MQLLFTFPDNDDHTIELSNFKDHYPRVNNNMDAQLFQVEIRKVTRDIIIPQITKEFYDDLANKYHTGGTLNEHYKHVLELLQDTIAEYTIWKLSPTLLVTLGDMGIQENHGKDGLTSAASQWRYKNYHWNVMVQADRHLDMVLQYLEENAAEFEKFKANRAKLVIDNLLVRTTADFEQFINIQSSRRTFRKLIPSLYIATKRHLIGILGNEFYAELLEQINEDNLTDENKELLQHAQEVIAHHAIHHAIPTLAVLIEEDGIFALSSTDGMNTKNLSHESRIQDLKDRTLKDANQAKAYLTDFLYVNEDDYPTWKNGDTYIKEGEDGRYPLDLGGGVYLG